MLLRVNYQTLPHKLAGFAAKVANVRAILASGFIPPNLVR